MSRRITCDGCAREWPVEWAEQCEWWEFKRATEGSYSESNLYLCGPCFARHFMIDGRGMVTDRTK
jgi:hypothetical protein